MTANALRQALRLGATLSIAAWVLSAQAQQAALVGPSVAKVGTPVEYSMKGMRANSSHSFALVRPGAGEAQYAAVADATGKLSHRFTPMTRGMHEVRVLNSKGQVVGSTRVMAH